MILFITRSLPVHEPQARRPRGSALLISLLLMAFLAVFGIGMSQLIVKSIRVERNVVEAGKAYFAAESGVERGLYFHENELPGYEVPESEQAVSLTNGTSYSYEMVAQDVGVPCSYESDEWRSIEVQESVSWPLFRYDAESEARVDLDHFQLAFFVDRRPLTPVEAFDIDSDGIKHDALRWKILGIDEGGNTQAISGVLEFSAAQPTETLDQDDTANFFNADPGGTAVNFSNYLISTFLANHTFNYLVLTNVIVPSAQSAGVQILELNRLKAQLSTQDFDSLTLDGSACEYTLIRSTGFAENTRQAIDSQVKLDSALPVFDFVLYQTN